MLYSAFDLSIIFVIEATVKIPLMMMMMVAENVVHLMCICLCAADRSVRPVDNFIELPNATDSRFGKHLPRDSSGMTALNFSKGVMARVM